MPYNATGKEKQENVISVEELRKSASTCWEDSNREMMEAYDKCHASGKSKAVSEMVHYRMHESKAYGLKYHVYEPSYCYFDPLSVFKPATTPIENEVKESYTLEPSQWAQIKLLPWIVLNWSLEKMLFAFLVVYFSYRLLLSMYFLYWAMP